MRVHRVLVLAAVSLAALSAIALAQVGTQVQVGPHGVRVETRVQGMRHAHGAIIRTKDMVGLSVYNAADESLGKIEDLVIDAAAGNVRYAVLSFGGVLGIGDKYFAVPWHTLSFVAKGESKTGTMKEAYCVLDVSKDALKNAPGFAKDNWPDFADANWNATIEQYYGGKQPRAATGARPLAR